MTYGIYLIEWRYGYIFLRPLHYLEFYRQVGRRAERGIDIHLLVARDGVQPAVVLVDEKLIGVVLPRSCGEPDGVGRNFGRVLPCVGGIDVAGQRLAAVPLDFDVLLGIGFDTIIRSFGYVEGGLPEQVELIAENSPKRISVMVMGSLSVLLMMTLSLATQRRSSTSISCGSAPGGSMVMSRWTQLMGRPYFFTWGSVKRRGKCLGSSSSFTQAFFTPFTSTRLFSKFDMSE